MENTNLFVSNNQMNTISDVYIEPLISCELPLNSNATNDTVNFEFDVFHIRVRFITLYSHKKIKLIRNILILILFYLKRMVRLSRMLQILF